MGTIGRAIQHPCPLQRAYILLVRSTFDFGAVARTWWLRTWWLISRTLVEVGESGVTANIWVVDTRQLKRALQRLCDLRSTMVSAVVCSEAQRPERRSRMRLAWLGFCMSIPYQSLQAATANPACAASNGEIDKTRAVPTYCSTTIQ